MPGATSREAPSEPWDRLVTLVDSFRASIQRAPGDRVGSAALRGSGKELVQLFFRDVRPDLELLGVDDLSVLDELMQGLLAATNGRASKSTYLSILTRSRAALSSLEAQRELRLGRMASTGPPVAAANQSVGLPVQPSETELKIVAALERLVPSAALSYRQALADLSNSGRVSFRGPANELREAFREVLDELAPDEDVMGQPGFRPEEDQTTPTQKQKVRYILRSEGRSNSERQAPEQATRLIEEMFASFARSAYQRSNVSAHVASARRDVLQMKMYIDSVLAELLQIHS